MATGIDGRHRRTCTAHRDDGKCCGASFQANVWDARSSKRIRKTFTNKTAAKQWRTDAMAAVRAGTLEETKPKTTVKDAWRPVDAGRARRHRSAPGR
jgi:hypothetical protein